MITERLNKLPQLKQALVWADINEVRCIEEKRDLDEHPHMRFPLFGSRYWGLDETDEPWLWAAVNDTSRTSYIQDTAYYFLLLVLGNSGNLHRHKVQLEEAAGGNELRVKWLQDALRPKTKPAWQEKQELRRAEHERKEKKRQGQAIASWRAFKRELDATLPTADYSKGLTNANWRLARGKG